MQNKVSLHPQVLATAPFVMSQVLMAQGEDMRGALVRGIDPAQEVLVTDAVALMAPEVLSQLQPGGFGVVLGTELARAFSAVALSASAPKPQYDGRRKK